MCVLCVCVCRIVPRRPTPEGLAGVFLLQKVSMWVRGKPVWGTDKIPALYTTAYLITFLVTQLNFDSSTLRWTVSPKMFLVATFSTCLSDNKMQYIGKTVSVPTLNNVHATKAVDL